jgi:hypothetical protein
MATPQPIPFWTQSGEGRSKAVTAEKLTNWYLERNPQNAVFPFSLMPTPGLDLLATLGTGPIRGIRPMGDLLWVVSGSKVYSVDSAYNDTERGDIAGTGDVFMTDNGTHVLVVTSSQQSYAVNLDEIVQIQEPDMVGAAYQDGYGIAGKRTTEQFFLSNLDDMITWTATDFTSADALADPLVGIASVHRLLWVFGAKTVEKWYNSGNATFPFERVQGGFLEIGCIAPGSIAVDDNMVLWLDNNLQVRMSAGGEARVISTVGIGLLIEADNSPQTALAWTYTQGHHKFYVLELQSVTLVYDMTTGLWAHRASQALVRSRMHHHVWHWREHIVGDYDNGNLYRMSLTTYAENSAELIREAISAPIHAKGNAAIMHELWIDMEMGVGLVTGQGSDPVVMVAVSDDGGNTWSNERTATIGKMGEYKYQARLLNLGLFKKRSIRIRVSDPVKSVITGAYMRTEALAA